MPIIWIDQMAKDAKGKRNPIGKKQWMRIERKLYVYLSGLFIEIAVSAFYAVLKFILVK